MTDLVQDTFSENGLLKQAFDNFAFRPQQMELAKAAQETFTTGKSLLAEAPTGVGKSLAALVPAFEYIQTTGKPVVVVTSSIVLQEQYIEKEIPFLEKLYNYQVNPVLIKGRNNYLCPLKHRDVEKREKNLSADETEYQQFQEIKKWANFTTSGDKNELEFVPTYKVWDQFSCIDSNDCSGKRCPLYDSCYYYKERNKVATSRLIVCNYHYFFTAVTSGSDKMLPNDLEVIIMDEGHEVTSIARDFQEDKYSQYTVKNMINKFMTDVDEAKMNASVGDTIEGLLMNLEIDLLNDSLVELFMEVHDHYRRSVTEKSGKSFLSLTPKNRWDFRPHGERHIKQLTHMSQTVQKYLDYFGVNSMEDLETANDMYGEESAFWFMRLLQFQERVLESRTLLKYLLDMKEEEDNPDDIFWVEESNKEVLSIHVKPTTAKALINPFFDREGSQAVIVMSATLSTNKSFDHLKKDFGIESSKYFHTNESIVSSPFPLEKNLLWYLPAGIPDGPDPRHLPVCLEKMFEVVMFFEGRSLCLFTSNKNLKEAEAYFRKWLPKHIRLLSQLDTPRKTLIKEMNDNDHTVIIGTKSMFTGIDVQGHHLSAVMIDKIPFPMLGDPINNYLMNQARGFHNFALPEAIISLKQGFGRLNRTSEDQGVVAVMDGRLSTSKYKNIILNSFDFKINATRSGEDVEEYAEKIKSNLFIQRNPPKTFQPDYEEDHLF